MPAQLDYLNHVALFAKQMATLDEFVMRANIFAATNAFIEEHNASGKSWKAGHNQFSDMTPAEYGALHGYKPD